jgi:hypothetical protein
VPAATVANINIDHLAATAGDVGLVGVKTARPAPIWLSMIDNKTGDGTFVPFSNFELSGVLDATIAIPQIASSRGAFGTRWRSDLYGLFEYWPALDYTERGVSLRANFYPASVSQCGGRTHVLENVPSTRWFAPDVASQITQCASQDLTGALELNLSSWTTGYSRTYTTRADGGTLGDILPMYPIGGWPVQHFSGISVRDGFRINLGLYNGLDYPVRHRLVVYAAEGTEAARHELTLAPRQSIHGPLRTLIGDLPNGLYGMTVLPLDAPGKPGRSWAYLSIVDNVSGDPTNLW